MVEKKKAFYIKKCNSCTMYPFHYPQSLAPGADNWEEIEGLVIVKLEGLVIVELEGWIKTKHMIPPFH